MTVHRMSGADAGFLYAETPTAHMHTLKVAVVDPGTHPGGYSFEAVRGLLAGSLDLLPAFRRRVVPVPLQLDHPVWIEDPEFDIDAHIHRVCAAAPGGQDELNAVVGEIGSRPLPRNRPLWDLTVVEGLAQGRIGIVVKVHHAVADGGAAMAMLQTVTRPEPDHGPPVEVAQWAADRLPRRRDLARIALAAVARKIVMFPLLLWRALRGRVAILGRRMRGTRRGAAPFRTPVTPFNAALTADRVFATTRLPMAEVAAVRKAMDVTVNDVMLAVCAGALRRYLGGHGVLPERPMVTSVPVGTYKGSEPRLMGNKVSNIFSLLPVDEPDPLERLRIVHEVTAGEKEELNIKGETMLEEWAEYRPPTLTSWLMHTYSRHRIANRHRPPINTITSNVPGPREELRIAGARIVEIYSVGPILEGIGLNVTAWSYRDTFFCGLLACPSHVDDLDRLAELMPVALDELAAASAAGERIA